MRKFLIIIFTIILMCSIVFSDGEYPNLGGVNSDYNGGDKSLFNEALTTSYTADSIGITDAQQVPLIYDLDNDDNNEIVVLANNKIRVLTTQFTTKPDMSVSATFNMWTNPLGDFSGDYFSNMIIYDIDADSIPEIIVFSIQARRLYILEYNGTSIIDSGYNKSVFIDTSNPTYSSDVMIGCGDSDGCVFVWNSRNRFTAGAVQLYANRFDENSMGADILIHNTINGGTACLPKRALITYTEGYYYITYAIPSDIFLSRLNVNTTTVTYSRIANSNQNIAGDSQCGGRGIDKLTPPIAVDYENDGTDNLVYGYNKDADEYKLIVYDETLTFKYLYPSGFDADGIIISNPIVMNAYSDGQGQSVCIVGYEKNDKLIDVLCIDYSSNLANSLLNGNNIQFKYSYTQPVNFNLSDNTIHSSSSHAIDSYTEFPFGEKADINEIVTPYGIFKLQDLEGCYSCYLSGNGDLNLIYSFPFTQEVAVVPSDVLEVGYQDMLGMTNNNLYYIDDGFTNRNAYVGYCSEVKPDPRNTWKLSTVDTYTINESSLNSSAYITSPIQLVVGKDKVNTYVQTWIKDGTSLQIKENNKNLRLLLNVTSVNLGLANNKLSMFVFWDSDLGSDNVRVYFKNKITNKWDFKTNIIDSTTFAWYNFSGDFSNYIQNNNIQILFNDTTNTDGGDSVISIDYFTIQEYGALYLSSIGESNEVEVDIIAIDPEETSQVQAKVILYDGESNQQDTGWSESFTSGESIPFDGLYPNKTTTGSTLSLCVKEIDHYNNTPNCLSTKFIVATEGDTNFDSSYCVGQTKDYYEKNLTKCNIDVDCGANQICISGYCEVLPPTCTLTSQCPAGHVCIENKCKKEVNPVDNTLTSLLFGLSDAFQIPVLIFIFIAIIAISVFIIMRPDIPPIAKFPLIYFISFFIIGVFTVLSVIGIIWIILMVIMGIAGASLGIVKTISSRGG